MTAEDEEAAALMVGREERARTSVSQRVTREIMSCADATLGSGRQEGATRSGWALPLSWARPILALVAPAGVPV
jgi:hypothetical protein